jgi:hypothetical protein
LTKAEIVGEAAAQVSEAGRSEFPAVAMAPIIGTNASASLFRMELLWDTVRHCRGFGTTRANRSNTKALTNHERVGKAGTAENRPAAVHRAN